MANQFTCKQCNECCGPVPISRFEFRTIVAELKKLPKKRLYELANQPYEPYTCILLDRESNCCSVYQSRPEICKMYGFYRGMMCPNNPLHATKSRSEGKKHLETTTKYPAGVLSLHIKWEHLLKEIRQ